jgi:branched-chain amino acid aminotransferase
MSRVVYLDGKWVKEQDAKLSIYDLSVMQAAAAFEMTRSFHGEHFKLRAHLERLQQSCRLLSLSFPWTLKEVEQWCLETSAQNDHGPGEEHRLLIVVSPGCAPMYKELKGVIPHPFLYIADFPLRYTVKGFGTYFTDGVHCVTSPIQQVPDACMPSAAKHRSRLHFHLAQQQAPPGTWPLMRRGGDLHYCEAPGANLAYVRHGEVVVVQDSALPGISLQTVQAFTRGAVGSLYPDMRMTELWLTGTPFCMLPVVSLDGRPIGSGRPGPVFQQTLKMWNDLVGLDIAKQIQGWDGEKM